MAKEIPYDIVTHSADETISFGRRLADVLQPPCIVLLEGDLGSGKTTLAKGIVAGLGAAKTEDVTSPSFTLVHEYGGEPDGRLRAGSMPRVVHVDLYRIESPREIESLGLDELSSTASTVLIEWGERLPRPPAESWVRIRMETVGESKRRIVVERSGEE
ncbi:MAG: tRNA (adenosine(37)-N6)-threonylcarbamoyltransferase complex ATPase subunit type 1 TsaE [Terriglobia bacterium]